MVIIHIDDNADDREMLLETVKQIDPNVAYLQASNGEEGYNLVQNCVSEVNCIFLDINMPLMNAVECLRLLKTNPRLANIPVVVYTSTKSALEVCSFYLLGAAYLQKTADYILLRNKLSSMLQNLMPADQTRPPTKKDLLWFITDSALEQDLLDLALRSLHANIEVVSLSDIKEASDMLADRDICVPAYIIVDTEVPDLDTRAILQLLNQHQLLKTSKIILYGVPDEADNLKTMIGNGAADFVLKSYSFSIFCAALQNCLMK